MSTFRQVLWHFKDKIMFISAQIEERIGLNHIESMENNENHDKRRTTRDFHCNKIIIPFFYSYLLLIFVLITTFEQNK